MAGSCACDIDGLAGIVFSGLPSLVIEDVTDQNCVIVIVIVVRARTAGGRVPCPRCSAGTSHVHCERTPADVPADGRGPGPPCATPSPCESPQERWWCILAGGSQFRSAAFVATLAASGLTGSMGRDGACGDNAAMESFFALLQKKRPGPSARVRDNQPGIARTSGTWWTGAPRPPGVPR